MYLAYGSYSGASGTTKHITGCRFTPTVVMIFESFDFGGWSFMTADMSSGIHTSEGDLSALGCGIMSLDADGFTVTSTPGGRGHVNTTGNTYYWYAFNDDFSVMDRWTHTGTGGATNISLPHATFTPRFVFFGRKAGTPGGGHWYYTPGGNASRIGFSSLWQTGWVDSASLGSFHTNGNLNASGINYYGFCFGQKTNVAVNSSYVGNGTDNRDITVSGWTVEPALVLLDGRHVYVESPGVFWGKAYSAGDASWLYRPSGSGTQPNIVQKAVAGGFQVGSDVAVNRPNETYAYFMLYGEQPPATPPLTTLPDIVPTASGAPLLPNTPYARYKSSRAATQMLNNLVLGP